MNDLAKDSLILQCDIGTIDYEALSQQIDAGWLTSALSERYPGVVVERSSIIRIIAGCSTKIWVEMELNAAGKAAGLPDVVVVKAGFNRHDPIMLFTYEIEVRAYRDMLPRYPINSPKCYYAGSSPDGESWAVILEDLTRKDVRFCHALTPLTFDEAGAFIDALAKFHAATWNKPELHDGSWPWAAYQHKTRAGLFDYFAAMITPENWAKYMAMPRGAALPRCLRDRDRFLQAFERLQTFDASQPQTVLVGDEHLGNLYIERDGTPGFFDFQSRVSAWSQGISYFIGAALDSDDRPGWERDLISRYLAGLTRHGIAAPSFDEAWNSYCCSLLFGFAGWVTNGTQFQTESVCTANTVRLAKAVLDNDTYARLGVS